MSAQLGDNISVSLGIIIGFGIGIVVATLIMKNKLKDFNTEAITHQCAIHDPITGDFTWLEKKDEH